MSSENSKKLDGILRHIRGVSDNCIFLGEKLIEGGEVDFGRRLIANGLIHDNSKLYGIEWLYLHDEVKETDEAMFLAANKHHVTTNPHHPEYWISIEEMPSIYIAEMVCDWKTRSSEFGTDLVEWVKERATKRFDFTTHGKVYKEIKRYLDMLLDTRFD